MSCDILLNINKPYLVVEGPAHEVRLLQAVPGTPVRLHAGQNLIIAAQDDGVRGWVEIVEIFP